jgi:polysaccharide pyruvyl transferase WcaK-like protein
VQNIKAYFKMISVLKKSDEVIFWGGGIIYDNEVNIGINPLSMRFFRARITKMLWCKLKSYAIWINIKNEENYSKLKAIFSLFDEITVRDLASQKHLKKVWIESKIIKDPVFSENNEKSKILQKLEANNFEARSINYELFKDKTVWIAVRDWFAKKDEIEKMIKTLSQNVKKIIIIPFSFHKNSIKENDYLFLQEISEKYWIEITKNISDSYKICKNKEIDIMIGMRLHSIILSYVYWINLVTISYSSKTEEIIKTLV